MDVIKEIWGDLISIPKDIGKDLTTTGKWTIWIPLTCGTIVLVIALMIMVGIVTLLNTISRDLIPTLYRKVYPTIKRTLYKEPLPHNHIDNYPHYLDNIRNFADINPINPKFWVDKDGNHPESYSVITKEDIDSGRYKPYNKA